MKESPLMFCELGKNIFRRARNRERWGKDQSCDYHGDQEDG